MRDTQTDEQMFSLDDGISSKKTQAQTLRWGDFEEQRRGNLNQLGAQVDRQHDLRRRTRQSPEVNAIDENVEAEQEANVDEARMRAK